MRRWLFLQLLLSLITAAPRASAFSFPLAQLAILAPERRHASAIARDWEFADPVAALPTDCIANPGRFRVSDPGAPYAFEYFEDIEKPDTDDRKYRIIRLANKIQALLISDPTTDKASAALDVKVGHLSDPKELQGLAHFCEHLLFMGTDKYPKENEYSQFLADHSGHSNAFTSLEDTNYFFEVGHQHLEGALDRFAQFFISPRFDPNCTERELRAVDSENKKNLQSDNWRLFQLEKSLSRPDHPYSNFGTGNLATLKEIPEKLGLDVREELLKFHRRYYSANVMRVAVLGRESLDELTKSVAEKFGPIVNNDVELPSWPGSPWSKEQALRLIRVKPIKDKRLLEIAWPYPDQEGDFASQPSHYISHFIGHEGSGSILSLLKKKGWANGLNAGTSGGGRGFDMFKVTVDLTEAGLENYESIIEIVFRYIRLLRRNGVQPYVFNEVKGLSEMSFRFREKSDAAHYTSKLARELHKPYPPVWILSASVMREFRPDLIEESLSHLNGENFHVTLVSQNFSAEGMARERWYGTEHNVEPISMEFREKIQHVIAGVGGMDDELHLPPPNAFIATNFETNKTAVDQPRKLPDLILSTPLARLWHKKDDTFWVPKGKMLFLLRTPFAYADVRTSVMTHLYSILLGDALTKFTYDAHVAGLSYSLENEVEGLQLSIAGFNEKMGTLLEKVVEKMKNFEVDEERFVLMKEILDRYYKNTELEAPYVHAMYYMNYTHQEKLFTHSETSSELPDITAGDVQRHISNLLSRMHIEALIMGNINREEALAHMNIVERILSPKLLQRSQILPHRSLILPTGKLYYYQKAVPDKDNVNSAIEYYCAVGDVTNARQRALLGLLAQVTEEPCFNRLRTKEQLGYLVFSGVRKHSATMGMRFIVQSERDTVYLENRIEAFLRYLADIIHDLSPEKFKKHVDSLILKMTEKLKNINEEARRYWAHIHSGYYEFDSIDTDVEHLRKVTKDDLLNFFMEHLHPNSTSRSKFSIHLRSQRTPRAPSTRGGAAIDGAKVLSCLTAHGSTAKIDDVEKAIADGVDNLEAKVRQMLIDEEGVDEHQIEAIMHSVAELLADLPPNDGGGGIGEDGKENEQKEVMPEGNVLIKDLVKFKAECELSRAPQPVVLLESMLSKL